MWGGDTWETEFIFTAQLVDGVERDRKMEIGEYFLHSKLEVIFPFLFFFLVFCVFLGLHPCHMEVPRLGIDTTSTTTKARSKLPL